MADTTALKNRIRAAIKANDNQEITGPVLQQTLLDIVDELDLNPELQNEAQQRQNSDNTLQQNITTEKTRAEGVEAQLNNLINGIKNNIDNGYVYVGIAAPSTIPVSGKVFYIAVQAGTYTNFGDTAVTEGITILKYNGTSWVKEQAMFTDGGVFDISAYNNDTYDDLADALSGDNVPLSVRKGGMSIKFMKNPDSIYVQYRCMYQRYTGNVNWWQEVDNGYGLKYDTYLGELFKYPNIWMNGTLNSSGIVNHLINNRVVTTNKQKAIGNITINRVDSDYDCYLYDYTTSQFVLITTPYTIENGHEFRLMIRKHESEPSGPVDIVTFINKITAYCQFSKKVDESIEYGTEKSDPNLWEHGSLNSQGTVYEKDNRIIMKDIQIAPYDILCAFANPLYYVFIYDYTNSKFETFSKGYIINQGVSYRLMVRRVTEDVSEVADINTFLQESFSLYTQIISELKIGAPADNPLIDIDKPKTFIRCFRSLGCIGDSLTEGGFNTTQPSTLGVVIKEFAPASFIKKITGIETVNLGISGAYATTAPPTSTNYCYIDNAEERGFIENGAFVGDAVCDAYYIALGTNDIGRYGSFTGDPSTDINIINPSQNAATSCGGYGRIISYIRAAQPKAPIFLVCISNTRNDEITRTEANTKIKAIAEKFDNCYVIDLQTYAETTQQEVSYFTDYYKNGSHNNALGYEIRANQIATYIDYIIKKNIDKFQDIQFIGSEYSY